MACVKSLWRRLSFIFNSESIHGGKEDGEEYFHGIHWSITLIKLSLKVFHDRSKSEEKRVSQGIEDKRKLALSKSARWYSQILCFERCLLKWAEDLRETVESKELWSEEETGGKITDEALKLSGTRTRSIIEQEPHTGVRVGEDTIWDKEKEFKREEKSLNRRPLGEDMSTLKSPAIIRFWIDSEGTEEISSTKSEMPLSEEGGL